MLSRSSVITNNVCCFIKSNFNLVEYCKIKSKKMGAIVSILNKYTYVSYVNVTFPSVVILKTNIQF